MAKYLQIIPIENLWYDIQEILDEELEDRTIVKCIKFHPHRVISIALKEYDNGVQELVFIGISKNKPTELNNNVELYYSRKPKIRTKFDK